MKLIGREIVISEHYIQDRQVKRGISEKKLLDFLIKYTPEYIEKQSETKQARIYEYDKKHFIKIVISDHHKFIKVVTAHLINKKRLKRFEGWQKRRK